MESHVGALESYKMKTVCKSPLAHILSLRRPADSSGLPQYPTFCPLRGVLAPAEVAISSIDSTR